LPKIFNFGFVYRHVQRGRRVRQYVKNR